MPREARADEEFVVLADGSIHTGATVVRRGDSVVMADGGELPELPVKLIAGAMCAPSRRRVVLKRQKVK